MGFFDYLAEAMALKAEADLIVQEGDALKVGEEMTLPIPNAKRINALLIKGHRGSRYRLKACTFECEHAAGSV
jgi:hypothetical protein